LPRYSHRQPERLRQPAGHLAQGDADAYAAAIACRAERHSRAGKPD
jgi:hypothetical protein